MAITSVPDKLRKLDVVRFVQRGAQLERLKPAIAYWCYYRIVEKILTAGLQSDQDCKAYTAALMDKLETLTAEHGGDTSITDDVAAAAYVELFGTETFQRAEHAIRANKVTRQTADTLQAAATFLELLHKWGAPSAEVESMIKYAKYHAVRILRAIKDGKDPNESNPASEEAKLESNEAEDPALDPIDPEVQKINAAASQQPSVEDEPEHGDLHQASHSDVQDVPDPGYFPTQVTPDAVPVHTPNDMQSQAWSTLGNHYGVSAAASANSPDVFQASPPVNHKPDGPAPSIYQVPPAAHVPAARTPTPPSAVQPAAGALITDDIAIADAQKHAKWAISALNFEDVPTAISELQIALRLLGAT